jgi:hypothetical protein
MRVSIYNWINQHAKLLYIYVGNNPMCNLETVHLVLTDTEAATATSFKDAVIHTVTLHLSHCIFLFTHTYIYTYMSRYVRQHDTLITFHETLAPEFH